MAEMSINYPEDAIEYDTWNYRMTRGCRFDHAYHIRLTGSQESPLG